MKKLKNISRKSIIIVALVFLNLVAFSLVSNGVKQTKHEAETISATTETNTYFKSGVDVLSWSYTLLKYFKQ